MQDAGSGGLAAASVGISEAFIGLAILAIVLFGVWKLAQLIWAAFSG
jgi:hypothetical protein